MSVYFLAVDSSDRLLPLASLTAEDFRLSSLQKPQLSYISASPTRVCLVVHESNTPPVYGGHYMDGVAVLNSKFIDVEELVHKNRPGYARSLRGSFFIAHHDKGGSIELVTDQLSMYPLFVYQNNNLFACSNDVFALVSSLDRIGFLPKKSLQSFALETTFDNPIAEQTGYEGITLLPPSSAVLVTERNAVSVRKTMGLESYFVSRQGYESLIDAAEAEIRGNVRAALTKEFRYRICDLTGGMDSRLMPAAIMAERATEQFIFATGGGDSTPDARVAELLRARVGLVRAVDLYETREPLDPLSQIATQLRKTFGCYSTLSELLVGVGRRKDILHLHGGIAEAFRGGLLQTSALEAPVDHFLGRISNNRLLTSNEVQWQQWKITDRFNWYADCNIPESAWADAFYLFERNRYHFGLTWRATNLKRTSFHPLYSPSAIKAALKLSSGLRTSNKVGFDLMMRLAPELVPIPFAGKRWDSSVYNGSCGIDQNNEFDVMMARRPRWQELQRVSIMKRRPEAVARPFSVYQRALLDMPQGALRKLFCLKEITRLCRKSTKNFDPTSGEESCKSWPRPFGVVVLWKSNYVTSYA